MFHTFSHFSPTKRRSLRFYFNVFFDGFLQYGFSLFLDHRSDKQSLVNQNSTIKHQVGATFQRQCYMYMT